MELNGVAKMRKDNFKSSKKGLIAGLVIGIFIFSLMQIAFADNNIKNDENEIKTKAGIQ